MSGAHNGSMTSPFKQPKAVFAVAFACVVSFMGIGLVDPILPAISSQLHASPSEVTLLFTSYLVVTAVAMLITNWVSSRIGAKRTLIAGLVVIVVFAALAGASHSVSEIIGFRAGWGVGNALFIATSVTTQAVMTVSPVERPVASAAYSFVRFIGGGLAPYVAGRLVVDVNIHVPFYIAAGTVALGIVILSTGHKLLAEAERVQAEQWLVAEYANDVGAATIIVGAATHHGLSALMDESASAELRRHAKGRVLVVDPVR
jgi:ACDE family multidrug resistance protein